MRIDLEVLNFVDHIITTSTSDSECVTHSVRDRQAHTEKQRISMRDLGVLSSFDFNITPSTSAGDNRE